MHAFSGFYNKFPRTLEDKRNTIKFLELESDCDEWNRRQIEVMIAAGLSDKRKGRQKEAIAATKRWSKDTSRFIKYYSTVEPKSSAPIRNWFHERYK